MTNALGHSCRRLAGSAALLLFGVAAYGQVTSVAPVIGKPALVDATGTVVGYPSQVTWATVTLPMVVTDTFDVVYLTYTLTYLGREGTQVRWTANNEASLWYVERDCRGASVATFPSTMVTTPAYVTTDNRLFIASSSAKDRIFVRSGAGGSGGNFSCENISGGGQEVTALAMREVVDLDSAFVAPFTLTTSVLKKRAARR